MRPVHALYVTDTSEYSAVPDAEERERLRSKAETVGQQATADVAERGDAVGLTVERELREGKPYEEILEYVPEGNIDLVVMGTHGRPGKRPLIGSTTLRVARNVDVPTLTVRFREDVDIDLENHQEVYDDVVIATDGSDGSMLAAEQGVDIAEMYGATVHALYVLDTNTYVYEDVPRSIAGLLKESGNAALGEIEEMCRERDVEIKRGVLRGMPSRKLLDYVDQNDVDLVTLGAHGYTTEAHLGSTTERVIRTSRQPTLSVR